MQERLYWVAVVPGPLIGNALIAGRSLLGGRMANPEILEGPTPAGGVRSEIYYFDRSGNSVDKSKAVRVIIRELDKDGNLILETFGHV